MTKKKPNVHSVVLLFISTLWKLKVVFYGDKVEEIDQDHLLDEVISPIAILATTTVKNTWVSI